MSDKFPTPWGHGGSGAPDGDDWVWAYSRNLGGSSYDDPPEMEDTRLFSAPKEVAVEVVQAVNGYAALVEEVGKLRRELFVAQGLGPNYLSSELYKESCQIIEHLQVELATFRVIRETDAATIAQLQAALARKSS